MKKDELEFQAAQYSFGNLSTKEMQLVVDELLNEGIYSDEFLDVVYPDYDTKESVGVAFERSMRTLNIIIPEYEEAVWVILRYHISRIANREIDALDGLNELMNEVYAEYDFQTKSEKYLGDSHGVERLIGLYWGYDDLVERPTEISINGKYGEETVEEIKREIIVEAEKWMTRFYGNDTIWK